MNPRSIGQKPSDTTSKEGTEYEPESRSWIRQVPIPPGRSLRVPPTIFVYALSGLIPQGAWVIDAGCQRCYSYARRIQDQHTRTRQTERLVLVMEQSRSFLGPGEIDKTSSGARFGSVGTVDSCLAANTGKYIFPLSAPEARRKRNDRNPAATPIRKSHRDQRSTRFGKGASPTNPCETNDC